MAKIPRDYSRMLKDELVELARKAGLDLDALRSLTREQIADRLIAAGHKIEARVDEAIGGGDGGRRAAPPAEERPAPLAGRRLHPGNGTGPSEQTQAVRAKYEIGAAPARELADLDLGLPELPEGYADNRVVLLPRDPRWLHAYWDLTNEHKEDARRRGGRELALRLYDVTDIVFGDGEAHGMWEQEIHELARSWYLPVPAAGRHYLVEIGYRGERGAWLPLARSNVVAAPVDRPSGRVHDVFVTIPFEQPLTAPRGEVAAASPPRRELHEALYEIAAGGGGVGLGASIGMSAGVQPSPTWAPGLSGAISSAALPSGRPPVDRARAFWLRADAELIVYGATEPDAELLIGGRRVPLRPDGTFSLRMHFPDGVQDFPIEAVAADRQEKRAVHLTFDRRTE